MTVRLHRGDLPDLSRYTGSVAIDTETMGLNPHRDRLCVVQLSSGWGSQALSEAQLAYAASDVLHLHALRERLDGMLAREGRADLAKACFEFLPTRAKLDLQGWGAEDIFAHS